MTQNNRHEVCQRLVNLGISYVDALELRRISMALHAWHELECGTDRGAVERDETTGKPYWYNAMTGRRSYAVPDRESGALKRLRAMMSKYAPLAYYVQGDPRGASRTSFGPVTCRPALRWIRTIPAASRSISRG